MMEGGMQENGEVIAETPRHAEDFNPVDLRSFFRKDEDEQAVPLWLITFTDVIALMLTFFVLLYAMSVTEEEKWKQIAASLDSQFTKEHSRPYRGGQEDVISIDRISTARALDLKYLKTLVEEQAVRGGIKDIVIVRQHKNLVISLPSDLVFKPGTAEFENEGKRAVFKMGEILSRIRNRVEIIGHSEPQVGEGSKSAYATNWELSLMRSVSVAALLKESGYMRDMTVRGLSSGRYDELTSELAQGEKKTLARRVDIVIMRD